MRLKWHELRMIETRFMNLVWGMSSMMHWCTSGCNDWNTVKLSTKFRENLHNISAFFGRKKLILFSNLRIYCDIFWAFEHCESNVKAGHSSSKLAKMIGLLVKFAKSSKISGEQNIVKTFPKFRWQLDHSRKSDECSSIV